MARGKGAEHRIDVAVIVGEQRRQQVARHRAGGAMRPICPDHRLARAGGLFEQAPQPHGVLLRREAVEPVLAPRQNEPRPGVLAEQQAPAAGFPQAVPKLSLRAVGLRRARSRLSSGLLPSFRRR
ncbi:hypothetical protein [Labrys monachus]|uniref:Uncharacterized protein n=1 Tax=Labrys monachus TaxID=217067 RepID=A0ABU0F6Q5_9HYPH|nr:hypothetical protein [Labrys monachus]MDQ0390296.1 hypothetical protein [Labrys monachus]